jgi:hypothetical protein
MPDGNSPEPEPFKIPHPLSFLATPDGTKAAEPIVKAYVAAFDRFPKAVCFLSGMAVMAVIAARRKAD